MYILQYGDYLIGQILEYNTVDTRTRVPVHDPVSKPTTQYTYHHIQCTLQHTATLCSLQPTIQCTSSAHTAAAITSPVHTAAMYSYLQPTFSAHCSHLQPSTLQLYYPVHTAATLSGTNTIQCIQCTSGPPQGKPIPLLAYLQSSQQTLMVYCSSP